MSKSSPLRWACASCHARFESADALRKHGRRIHKIGVAVQGLGGASFAPRSAEAMHTPTSSLSQEKITRS
jgi:hypothetical protein